MINYRNRLEPHQFIIVRYLSRLRAHIVSYIQFITDLCRKNTDIFFINLISIRKACIFSIQKSQVKFVVMFLVRISVSEKHQHQVLVKNERVKCALKRSSCRFTMIQSAINVDIVNAQFVTNAFINISHMHLQ